MPASRQLCALVLVLGFSLHVRAASPEVVSLEKIWDRGNHNAFTDLIRWQGQWYCTFRESTAHVGGDGKLRILTSRDGQRWDALALIAEEGVDLRDPKLSITDDDRLMIVAGGSIYKGTRTLMGRQPRVTFSRDGKTWTAPQRILTEGEWLWRVTWFQGKAYGVSYNASARTSREAQQAAQGGKVLPGPADWKLKLFVSRDGVKYDLITHLDVPGHPNETTVRFLPNGEMIALVRREGGNTFGWIGHSKPPYTKWEWKETSHRLGGPNFLLLPDGSLWAAGRSYPGGAKTILARLTPTSYTPMLTLKSGSDTSYPGLVWHQGLLWMSYYSSHEGKSSIYLAKIKLPLEAEDLGSRRELLVDDSLLLERQGNVTFQVQQPTPREVVLTTDAPWEGNTSAYFTIFQDGSKLRMYYRGSHFDEKTRKAPHREVTCYAESTDGIHWTKPNLSLFAFEGSRKNNIVWDGEGTHDFTPFKDGNPRCPAEVRYKALGRTEGGLLAFGSPDGIHWKLLRDKPVITRGAFDSQNLAFWDPQIGKYREYHRAFRGVRDIMTGTSADFLNWSEPFFLTYPDAPREQLYTNAIQPYLRAPHLLLGFPTRFLAEKQQTEPVFMASRDGTVFQRYPQAVIPRTAPRDRDGNRSNYMTWGMVQLPGQERELSVYATEAYYRGPGSRVRRFVYRLDGFVALHGGSEGGEVRTRPIRFTGDRLVLNYKTTQQGSVRIELTDSDGQPLPGFSAREARVLQGDELAAPVSWEKGSSLRKLVRTPLCLRFILKDADVFSFRFE